MKKLLLLTLLVSCKTNPSIDFIKMLSPDAECQEMGDYTSVCKVPFPTKENPQAKQLFFCHAAEGTKPDCDAYGKPPEKAEAAVPPSRETLEKPIGPFGK